MGYSALPGFQIGEQNRERVYQCLMENPGIQKKEIAEKLNMNPMTVGKHVKSIREGWKPKENKVNQ